MSHTDWSTFWDNDASYDSYGATPAQHPVCTDSLLAEVRRLRLAQRQLDAWRDRLLDQALALHEASGQTECGLTSCPHCRELRAQRGRQ